MRRGSILLVAILSEAVLVLLAYVLAYLFALDIVWNPSLRAVALGVAAAFPLLLGNHLLWRWTQRNPDTVYARFSREVVVPLCRRVTPSQAFWIGVLSGLGEEALFRGSLNLLMMRWGGVWLALIISSIAFAWVHFIGSFKRYGGMIPLYSAVGAVLWLVWFLTDSLAAAAATHATYNFIAIIAIRRLSSRDARST
jgi:membrane protease YdiL (CAAX protease family)